MSCLSSENLKEGKVETTSLLTLVLWTTIVKLLNPRIPPQTQQKAMFVRRRPQRGAADKAASLAR
jgi:hypothetical protein